MVVLREAAAVAPSLEETEAWEHWQPCKRHRELLQDLTAEDINNCGQLLRLEDGEQRNYYLS